MYLRFDIKIEDKELKEACGGKVITQNKLKTCPSCGKTFSKEMNACPHCGMRIKLPTM